MPIFAYRCESCGFQKDVLQKRSDPPLVTCPECGRDAFAKQLTAPAFQLKGSGWYVTDFRDKGKASGKEADSGGGAGAADKPAGQSAPAGGAQPAATSGGSGSAGASGSAAPSSSSSGSSSAGSSSSGPSSGSAA